MHSEFRVPAWNDQNRRSVAYFAYSNTEQFNHQYAIEMRRYKKRITNAVTSITSLFDEFIFLIESLQSSCKYSCSECEHFSLILLHTSCRLEINGCIYLVGASTKDIVSPWIPTLPILKCVSGLYISSTTFSWVSFPIPFFLSTGFELWALDMLLCKGEYRVNLGRV